MAALSLVLAVLPASATLAAPNPAPRPSDLKVTPFAGAAAIVGRIQPSPGCEKGELQAWLSIESNLLYQVDVALQGSFEFHVNPGKYNLVVTSSTGCFVEAKVEVAANQLRSIDLKPALVRKSASRAWDWVMPSAQADCPYCNMMAYSQMQPSFVQPMPWWGYYGGMTYPNFAYPGPWGMGMSPGMDMGMPMQMPMAMPMQMPMMNGGYYPGHGGFSAGKPALYFEGKDGTEVSVRVSLQDQANWLVAVPSHGEKAWTAKLRSNRLVVEGAEFPYFFYDYRANPASLQDTAGVCAARGDLIPKLQDLLKRAGFKANEVKDFADYWSVKLPPSGRYCVYPQTQTQIDAVAHLDIQPAPTSITQVLFLIQVEEALTGKGRFAKAPTQTWQPTPVRAPASADGIQAREWGVAFLMSDKK